MNLVFLTPYRRILINRPPTTPDQEVQDLTLGEVTYVHKSVPPARDSVAGVQTLLETPQGYLRGSMYHGQAATTMSTCSETDPRHCLRASRKEVSR